MFPLSSQGRELLLFFAHLSRKNNMIQKCVLYDTTVGGLCLSFSFDYVTNTLLMWVGLKQKGATGTRGVSYMPEHKNVPGDFPSLSIFVYPTENTEEGLTTWRDKV